MTIVGQKQSYTYENVTFPYDLTIRHKDLPLQVFTYDTDNKTTYYPLAIKSKSPGITESILWLAGGGVGMVGLALGGLADKGAYIAYTAPAGGALFAACAWIGARCNYLRVPDAKNYSIVGLDREEDTFNGLNESQQLSMRMRLAMYRLIQTRNFESNKIVLAECKHLMNEMGEKDSEVYFLQALAYYNLGNEAKTIKNLQLALQKPCSPSMAETAQNLLDELWQARAERRARRMEAVANFVGQVTANMATSALNSAINGGTSTTTTTTANKGTTTSTVPSSSPSSTTSSSDSSSKRELSEAEKSLIRNYEKEIEQMKKSLEREERYYEENKTAAGKRLIEQLKSNIEGHYKLIEQMKRG